jgi:Na+/H+-dicarboxylate symporter
LPYVQNGCGIYALTGAPKIEPYFNFHIPQLISSDKIMLVALLFGIIFSFIKVPKINLLSNQLQQIITRLLVKGFIPFLPFYILGFALKMNYEGGLSLLFKSYSGIFMINCGVLSAYLMSGYMIGSGFNPRKTFAAIKNMLSAGITGFSTMSSAITMPVTLTCTEKNLENPQYADLIIPFTANIHMMGDALSIPLLTFGVMQLCGEPLPNLHEFLLFVPAFCLAKFSLAAVPGGTIIVMLPVLQSHFHLSPEATSLITTLYILQDSIFTSGNVMGNGAFALISFKVLKKLKLIK